MKKTILITGSESLLPFLIKKLKKYNLIGIDYLKRQKIQNFKLILRNL